jgi:hypothetical protein
VTRTRLGLVLVLVVLIVGCGGTEKAKVRGKVTLDGQPLATGQVVFEGPEKTTPTVIPIKNGEYEGEAWTGSNKVRISSFMAKKGDSQQQNAVGAKYNTATELVRDVGGGSNEFNFEVTSK